MFRPPANRSVDVLDKKAAPVDRSVDVLERLLGVLDTLLGAGNRSADVLGE
jgi:hypothetical protein